MPPCDGAAQVEAGEAGEVVEQGRGRRGREVAAPAVVAACIPVPAAVTAAAPVFSRHRLYGGLQAALGTGVQFNRQLREVPNHTGSFET